jgi:hypothetical protein
MEVRSCLLGQGYESKLVLIENEFDGKCVEFLCLELQLLWFFVDMVSEEDAVQMVVLMLKTAGK